jgi:flagellar hook-associated protein 1 FlgK
VTGDSGSSVLLNGVNRQLDQYLQTQIRTGVLGRRLCRYPFDLSRQSAERLEIRDTGTIENAFNTS